jgi:hypothetical protein
LTERIKVGSETVVRRRPLQLMILRQRPISHPLLPMGQLRTEIALHLELMTPLQVEIALRLLDQRPRTKTLVIENGTVEFERSTI